MSIPGIPGAMSGMSGMSGIHKLPVIPVAIVVLLAVTALALLAWSSVYMMGMTKRIEVVRVGTRVCANACRTVSPRAIRVFEVTLVSVAAGRLTLHSTPLARALVAAVRCGSVDTLVVGQYIVGLTGRTGRTGLAGQNDDVTEDQVWVGIGDGDTIPATVPPLNVSPSLTYLMASFDASTPTLMVLFAWKRDYKTRG